MQTKKLLSLLLALAMMFSLAVTASAAEEDAESLEGSIVIPVSYTHLTLPTNSRV